MKNHLISSEDMLRSAIIPGRKIAFVMSPRLGDALIAMTLVHNLVKQGYDIAVYSNFIFGLRKWFPDVSIFPYPDKEQAAAVWKKYDVLLHRYLHDVRDESDRWHSCVLSLSELSIYRQCMNEVDLQLLVCQEVLQIKHPHRSNGICIPEPFAFRRHSKRVAIHPTASMKTRYWLPKYFVRLAKRLIRNGYEPVFLIAPHEDQETLWIEGAGLKRVVTASIENAAEVIAESGWFIGNDSGLGHLASCLGIPTISMHQRRKVRVCWHPGFALNKALLPRVNLVIKSWKENYWKYFLTVNQVHVAFIKLVKTYSQTH